MIRYLTRNRISYARPDLHVVLQEQKSVAHTQIIAHGKHLDDGGSHAPEPAYDYSLILDTC